jgi:hypothetical protein
MKQKNSWLILGVCLLASFLSLLFFSRSSFLYPINTWVDSNASLTVGSALMHGKVLYADIFDQRGPFLYLLYGLASLVSSTTFTGVFLLECMTLTGFLYYSYRVATLYVTKNAMMVIPILAIVIPSSKAFGLGGSPEELLLPAFAYGLYSLLAFLKRHDAERPSTATLLINGFLMGSVFWTKYSMMGFYIGFVVSLTVALIVRKRAKQISPVYGLLLGGFVLATIPWFLYFGLHHAISDWFQGYFVSNLTHYMVTSESVGERVFSFLENIRNTLARNLQYSLFFLAGMVWVLFGKKQALPVLEKISILLCAALLTIVIYAGGKDYYYYGIPLSTFSVFGIILVLRLIEQYLDKASVLRTLSKIGLVGLSALLLLFGLTTSRNTPFLSAKADDYVLFRFRDEVKKSESSTLFNYGSLDLGLFNLSDITPSTRYFCTLNLRSEEMLQEIDGYLHAGTVEFIVSLNDDLATKFDRYELVDSGYSVINEGRTDVYLYQLKSAMPAN